MNRIDWSRLPLLLVVGGLVVYGSVVWEEGGGRGEATAAVGFLLLGVWATTEVIAFADRRKRKRNDEEL